MEEQQRTLLVPLKEDFIQFDVKEPEKPAKEEPKKRITLPNDQCSFSAYCSKRR